MKTKKMISAFVLSMAASALVACGSGGEKNEETKASPSDPSASSSLGRINAALTVPEDAKHDVAMATFIVVDADGECTDEPIATTTAAIEDEALVPSLETALEAGYTAFVDGLMTLPPGDYKVCVQPLKADGTASDECAMAEGTATVFPELTTEIVLTSQCDGNPNGALDVVTTFNTPPVITNIQIGPSKFITTCETAVIDITAEDPEMDGMTYSWEMVSGPSGGVVIGDGPSATFTAAVAGDYEVKVTVFDDTGAQTSLTFPIHVSEADGECASTCPEGTIEAAGFCFVQAQAFESGVDSCARLGLTGAVGQVQGLEWTAELMDVVTTALGCENRGEVGCCQSHLKMNVQTNECTTQGFHEENGQFFTNALGLPGQNVSIHACQRPVASEE